MQGNEDMSKVIKGGTVVTADLSYAADVKIDGDGVSPIGLYPAVLRTG